MQMRPDGHAAGAARALLIELQDVAGLQQESFLRNRCQFLGHFHMPPKLPVLTVDRHKVLGPDDVQHQLQFFRAAMSGDVDGRLAAIVVMHSRPAPVKVIEHAEDGLLVAGNHPGAQHHFIAGVDA